MCILLVPKIAFEELLEEKYAHFGLFEDKISPTQTHPVLLEEKYAHFGLFEDKISPTQTHPVFSEQVNATRVVAFTMRSYSLTEISSYWLAQVHGFAV